MNGMAYGIGGFVSGLVEGAELKNRWGDRKRRQKLEDEDRALSLEDRQLRLEDRQRRIALDDEKLGWARADRAIAQEERERAEREKAERDGVAKKAYEDTKRSIERKRGAASQPGEITGAPAAPMQPGVAVAPGAPRSIARPAAPGAGPAPAAPGPASPAAPPMPVQPAPAARTPTERPPQPYGISRAGVGRVYTNPPEQAAQPSARGVMPGTDHGITPPVAGIAPAQPQGAAGGTQPALPTPQKPAPKAPVPSASPTGEMPVTPSVEIAVGEARGIGGARGESDAVGSFLDEYRKVGAPQVVEYFVAKGDIESAKGFSSWIEDEEVKDGQRAWARGVQAATMGDEEGFFNSMVDAYNSTGYFDDGFQAVREKSGLHRAEDGSITGAFITYRDEETGQENRVDYDDVSDLYEMGIQFLSPEAVFEHGMEQLKAADEARKGNLEHQRDIEIEREKARLRGEAKTPQQQIDAEIEELRRTDFSFAGLPVEQQTAKAIASLEAKRAAAESFGAVQRGVVAARGE